MKGLIFRNMCSGQNVFAFGKFHSNPKFLSGWGFSAVLEAAEGDFYEENFCISNLSYLGAIFRVSMRNFSYESHNVVARFRLPSVTDWSESNILECSAFPRFSEEDAESLGQRCFSFHVDGRQIWLPKLELAGRLFFHDETLIGAAFVPSGLDFNFCVMEDRSLAEINAISKIGVEPWVFESKSYREYLGWLLMNKDLRVSYESIWRCLNQERKLLPTGGRSWEFNFIPPGSVSGIYITVMGCFSPDKHHFLIWEIVKMEIPWSFDKKLVFRHPDMQLAIESDYSECAAATSISVDSILFEGEIDTVLKV